MATDEVQVRNGALLQHVRQRLAYKKRVIVSEANLARLCPIENRTLDDRNAAVIAFAEEHDLVAMIEPSGLRIWFKCKPEK